jgi:UDP-glucose 4-epimerase
MRILITGGAGSLGSNLVEWLLPKGHEVLVIDNFATSMRGVLPEDEGLEIVEGSIADRGLVDRCFNSFQPTHVIHSAASYKDPQDWKEDVATNIEGMINVIESSKRSGMPRFINFQTVLCYGRPTKLPISIDQPLAPFTSYGITKTTGEQFLALSGLPFVSLRLANVTGPRLAIGPIPTFYKRLKAGQDCFCSATVREFLDISDFLVLMSCVLKPNAPCGIYNVSSGVGHSIKEVFDTVAEYLAIYPETPVPVVPPGDDDVGEIVLDPSETEKAFGWKAEVSFIETVHRMLEWYDKHGIDTIYSHIASAKK